MARIRIFGFAGSLRKDSYNKGILRATSDLLPDETELEIFDLEGIPLFSQELELNPCAKVREFKEKIEAADALLIVTPEYNYSIPGVLKNAIDWGSRPYGDSSFDEKPVAIMGASIGSLGSIRAQHHLRQSCVFLNMHLLNKPEVMVGNVNEKFDSNGQLTDEKTKENIRSLIVHLVAWSKKINLN
jgi:chromate reductase